MLSSISDGRVEFSIRNELCFPQKEDPTKNISQIGVLILIQPPVPSGTHWQREIDVLSVIRPFASFWNADHCVWNRSYITKFSCSVVTMSNPAHQLLTMTYSSQGLTLGSFSDKVYAAICTACALQFLTLAQKVERNVRIVDNRDIGLSFSNLMRYHRLIHKVIWFLKVPGCRRSVVKRKKPITGLQTMIQVDWSDSGQVNFERRYITFSIKESQYAIPPDPAFLYHYHRERMWSDFFGTHDRLGM